MLKCAAKRFQNGLITIKKILSKNISYGKGDKSKIFKFEVVDFVRKFGSLRIFFFLLFEINFIHF